MRTQRVFEEGLTVYAVLSFGLLVWSVQNAQAQLAVLAVLLSSPVLLAVLRVFPEKGTLRSLIDFKRGSWAFQVGDTFVLTAGMALCALAWRNVPRLGLFVSWQWVLGCLLLGFVLAAMFHAADTANYVREGVELALNSPTKLAHDFVALRVLPTGLLGVGVPTLFHWSVYTRPFLVCVGIHLVLMVIDYFRGEKGIMQRAMLHPEWDNDAFAVVSSPALVK